MARKKAEKQTTPGRVQGVPNLKRTDAGVTNQYGIEFTFDEKRLLENAVRRANRKRKKLLDLQASLPRYSEGKPIGTVGDFRSLGEESDFILARKSSSLQGYKNKEQFYRYMGYLEKVNASDYVEKRVDLYRNNFGMALIDAFGDDAEELLDAMMAMSPTQFANKVAQTDEDLDIGFLYLPGERSKKLNQIRKALGLAPVETPLDDEILDLKPKRLRERLKRK